MTAYRCLLAVLLLAPAAARAGERYRDVLIRDVPHIRQKPDFCGEACAAMYLQRLGHAVDQDYVFDQSGLDPALGRGCRTRELVKALRKIGFRVARAVAYVDAAKAGVQMEAQWRALHADLVRGVPSIICTRYDERPRTSEHFRLVLGYDSKKDEVIYHESAEARGAYRRMLRSKFLSLWPLKYTRGRWTVIRMPLAPGRIAAAPRPAGRTAADYAQHVIELKKRLPRGNFTIVVKPPFVVVGDEAPRVVRRRAVRTVQWAVGRLKEAYFRKDPDEILDIWLFKDKASYRKHTAEIFGEEPGTPFGYYSREHGALIMNIATGGGTLVHEIVHPFVAANFPGCPAWFNEGLGSLYEQCGERDGRIRGYTNWRLAGLQQAIRAGRLPSVKALTGTTDGQFYSAGSGSNYAQARYLLYYLQEKGLLRRYYRAFHRQREKDPSGYGTLKEVLGVQDMKKFQKDWQQWVLRLRFP